MSNKPDLSTFYSQTLPKSKNISRLYENSKDPNTFNNKNSFIAFSNDIFGMLAHFNLTSFYNSDRDKWEKRIDEDDFRDFRATLTYFKVLRYDKESNEYLFNPAVIPLVKKYRSIFDEYEKQNNIISFYKQFEGKEPGDN